MAVVVAAMEVAAEGEAEVMGVIEAMVGVATEAMAVVEEEEALMVLEAEEEADSEVLLPIKSTDLLLTQTLNMTSF